MLVHDHVRSLRDLDGPIRQLLDCTTLYKLGEYLGGVLVVLGLLLGNRQLDLQVLHLCLVIFLQLMDEELLDSYVVELFSGATALGADLQKMGGRAV